MTENVAAAAADTIKVGSFTVNRMGYGAMRITGNGVWGPPADEELANKVLKQAVELGVNFIDTADAYGPEVSENLIHEALHPYDGIVIATKGGLTRSGPGQWHPEGSPEHLHEACEASLRRLGVDQIAVYQLHRPDPRVKFEDSVQALIDLKNQGKIKHIGLSNVSVDQLKQALDMTEIVSVQNRYNLLDRGSKDVLRVCEEKNIAFLPWFPMGGGMTPMSEQTLNSIATTHQATPHQISLAWLLADSPVMLPIPGTSSLEHLEENVAAAAIKLTDDEIAALDKLED